MRKRIGNFSHLRTIFMLQAATAFHLGRKHFRLVSSMKIQSPRSLLPYSAPSFARHFKNPPKHRLDIANFPTPLQNVDLSNTVSSLKDSVLQPLRDLNIQLLVKRDDMTAGVELGGNKIRKLEFLLADALDGGYDSVITIGGEQSNHCRATATACRMVGLEPHLILRTKRANQIEESEEEDPFGYVGNILFDRMAGAHIHTCTPGEYGRVGSPSLIDSLAEDLEKKEQKVVYKIPVGGSNALGTWGYIDAVDEFMNQVDGGNEKIDHVVFASGSGGTAAGICLGLSLAYLENKIADKSPTVHAVGVCDHPDYFYETIASIAEEMGLDLASVSLESGTGTEKASVEDFVRDNLIVHQGKGLGYASSTQEELDFIIGFALETGISLDPVYSGKALFQFMNEVKQNPESYRNSRVVFWHTGGSLGNYEKVESLRGTLQSISPVERMDVYGKMRSTKSK